MYSLAHFQVERIKEIPVEVEKVVYSEKIIPQEVVIEVPKVRFQCVGVIYIDVCRLNIRDES